ncbi:MAG: TolC family protein [Myxococcales bacterium]|nr:TolC family protein [Myxococcales bacterium]
MSRRSVVCVGLLTSFVGAASITRKGGAQPAVVAPVVSTSAKVNEDPAPPIPKPGRSVGSFKELWSLLPKNASDLRIALAEVERAEAATRIAQGAVLPQANASLGFTWSPASAFGAGGTTFGGLNANAQLSVTATLVNLRAFHNIGTVKVGEEITALGVLEVRRKLGLSLARAVASIVAAQRLAEGNRESLELSRQRLGLTRKRLAAGVGDARDLVRALQDVAAARASVAPNDESLLQAQEGLGVVVGTTDAIGVTTDLDGLEGQLVGFCGKGSGKPRTDIQIAKKQILVAERNVDDITLKFMPNLTAGLSAGVSGRAFDGPWNTPLNLSLTLSIPLYDGGIRYAEKRDRIALVEEAKARAVAVELAARIEQAQAKRALGVAVAAQTSAKEARDLAAEALRLAQLAYEGGVGTNFDLIDAGRLLRQSETTLVLRDFDVARARLVLPFLDGACDGLEK